MYHTLSCANEVYLVLADKGKNTVQSNKQQTKLGSAESAETGRCTAQEEERNAVTPFKVTNKKGCGADSLKRRQTHGRRHHDRSRAVVTSASLRCTSRLPCTSLVVLVADALHLREEATVVHIVLSADAHAEEIHEGIDFRLASALAKAEVRQHALELGSGHCNKREKKGGIWWGRCEKVRAGEGACSDSWA